MVRELDADYETELLFPPRMEDWVGPTHIARFVREFVGMLDLEALGFSTRTPKVTGRPGLTARLVLSAWVYGYLTRQRSTRLLERACQSDIGAIWLTGNHQPDHSTLHNYFKDHRKAFKKLLKESALLACRMGLVDMSFVAIDGTKLKASTAFRESIVAKDLEIALASLDADIERYLSDVEVAGDSGCAKLPEGLDDVKKLREAIARDLAELKELGASILSPVDPDARMMQTRDGTRPAYNAQAGVDSNSGIILAGSVTLDANDSGQLNLVIDQVEENVGLTPDLTVADTGYFAAAQFQIAEDKGRRVDVAMKGRVPGEGEPLHSWLFVYDAGRDLLVCPIGGELPFSGAGLEHDGKDPVRRFHCDCYHMCPFAKTCSKSAKGRVIAVGLNRDAALRQWERQKNEDHYKNRKKRGATVERIFGHIKRNFGLRRLEHRGLDAVEAVWSTILCATNLTTIYRVWKTQA